MKPKLILGLALVLSGGVFDCSTIYAEEIATNSQVSNQMPLTLTIEAPKSVVKGSEGISFTVVFHNNSTNNLLLNAGQMLGNGSQLWDNVEAELKSEVGQRISGTLRAVLGQNSKIVQRVYARKAQKELPSLEENEAATRRAEESGKILVLKHEAEVPKVA